jgi:hypothetical protein
VFESVAERAELLAIRTFAAELCADDARAGRCGWFIAQRAGLCRGQRGEFSHFPGMTSTASMGGFVTATSDRFDRVMPHPRNDIRSPDFGKISEALLGGLVQLAFDVSV